MWPMASSSSSGTALERLTSGRCAAAPSGRQSPIGPLGRRASVFVPRAAGGEPAVDSACWVRPAHVAPGPELARRADDPAVGIPAAVARSEHVGSFRLLETTCRAVSVGRHRNAASDARNAFACQTATLHYIYDPLCGWCYGSSPLVQAARQIEGLKVVLRGGGMLAGARRQLVNEQLRELVAQHAPAHHRDDGQALRRCLHQRAHARWHRAARLRAADRRDPRGRSGDRAGRRHARPSAGSPLRERPSRVRSRGARGSWPPRSASSATCSTMPFGAQVGSAVQNHIDESRRLLSRVGGQGFPTFVLRASGLAGRTR